MTGVFASRLLGVIAVGAALAVLVWAVVLTSARAETGGTVRYVLDEECDMSTAETIIEAPPAFVFPYITEGEKIAAWAQDDKLIVDFPRGTEAREGMQIRFTIRLPTDPHWVVEITRLDQDREMETEMVDGIFRGQLNFRLDPVDGGRTRLVHEAKIVPEGPFMRFAWEVAGERIHREKVVELLQRITEAAENDYRKLVKRAPR